LDENILRVVALSNQDTIQKTNKQNLNSSCCGMPDACGTLHIHAIKSNKMPSKKLQLLTFQKTIPKIEENQKEIQLT
jgi:hypothetical protein